MKRGKCACRAGVCLAFVVFACGETNDGAGSGGDIPLASLPAEYAGAYCSVIEQCLATYLALVPIPDCQKQFQRTFENTGFEAINEAITAGVVRYDAHMARVCVDELRALGCDIFTHRSPASCDAALAGDVPLGSACSINAECVGDAFCDQAAGTCPGVCAVRRDDGADCISDEGCKDGLKCDDLKCVAPAQAGHPCAGANEPSCRTGLVCVGATATVSGTCADPATLTTGKLGDTCDIAAQRLCVPALACVIDPSVTTGVAFHCVEKSASGARCVRGLPEPCPAGEYCASASTSSEGVCTKFAAVGEACSTDASSLTRCATGLTCSSGTCRERNVNGGVCAAADECYSAHCRNGTCTGDEFCTP